jgi:hypothetical protein
MQNLRAALEKLDEALDLVEEAAASRRPAPVSATAGQILPVNQNELQRAELIRRLDATIEDVQNLLGRAA